MSLSFTLGNSTYRARLYTDERIVHRNRRRDRVNTERRLAVPAGGLSAGSRRTCPDSRARSDRTILLLSELVLREFRFPATNIGY